MHKKQIFGMIAAFVGLAIAAYYVHSTSGTRAMNNGNVVVSQQPADAPLPPSLANPATFGTGTPGDATTPATPDSQAPAATPVAIPLNRTPPNGMAYKGTGKFLIYRQGDLTWRLDSETGNACVLFATNTQWSKSNVYDHGCATS